MPTFLDNFKFTKKLPDPPTIQLLMLSQPLKRSRGFGLLIAIHFALGFAPRLDAQKKPYFVTYSHDLEEPGNLEIESNTTLGQPDDANRFGAMTMELEYGVRAVAAGQMCTVPVGQRPSLAGYVAATGTRGGATAAGGG